MTFNTGQILKFPRIHPFGWEAWSSRRRVYLRQATKRNCQKSPVSLVTKYCPTSTTRMNPASFKIYSLCFLVKAIQLVECIASKMIWSFLGSSSWTGTSALISPRTIDRPIIKFTQSISMVFKFFAYVGICSVGTELIGWNYDAKNCFNRSQVSSSWQWTCTHGKLGVRFLQITATSVPKCCPKFLVYCSRKNTISSQNLVQ